MVTDLPFQRKPLSIAELIRKRAREVQSWLCIGLDPDVQRLPSGVPASPNGIVDFCKRVVESTSDSAAAYKVNFAFFEVLGPAGWEALFQVRAAIPADIPVIADAKRGDISNTARLYADAIFKHLGFDAATVNPYLGWDSLQPFFEYPDKGVFVLCRTSNPGASDPQDLRVGNVPLYLHIARGALALDVPADVGLVVGATEPTALREVRSLDRNTMLLVPGVGAQGGAVQDAMTYGANDAGENALINVSREIIHASTGADYAEAARLVAQKRASQTWNRNVNAIAGC